MNRPCDHTERERIETDLEINMMVEASAGSGKTESLSRRIANALVTGTAEVGRTAAVTFTRKAAAELRSRLRLTLERHLSNPDKARADRARSALDQLERMFVGTIHSFCGRLLRQYPVEAGVSPGFRELDQRAQGQMMGECFAGTINTVRFDHPELLTTLSKAGIRHADLLSALATLCQQQDVLYEHPSVPPPDPYEGHRRLQTFFDEMSELIPEVVSEGSTCSIQKSWRTFRHRYRLAEPDELMTVVRCMAAWKTDMTTVKKWWPGSGADRKAYCEGVEQCVDDFARLYAEPFIRQWKSHLYGKILILLNRARDDFQSHRHRTAQLDFGDLLWLCARLLRDNLDVRRRLQDKFRWVFIDEFQDTDPLQAEVMLLLAADPAYQGSQWYEAPLRPGALFVVGDPKQSIYRFRRADIDISNQVRSRVIASGGVSLTLRASFRSISTLCEWTNTVFSSLFPGEATPGQAVHSALEAVRERARGDLRGVYTLTDHGTGYPELPSREADRLAGQIVSAVEDGDYQWGDFLILTARTREVPVYSRALEARRVPVEVTGGVSQELAWVTAFKSLLRVLADPQDTVATVGVLRGPLYGLDDESLYQHRAKGGRFLIASPGLKGAELVLGALRDLQEMRKWTGELPVGAAAEKILGHTGVLALASTSNQGEGEVPALMQFVESLRELTLQGRSLAQALDLLELQAPSYPLALNAGRRDVVRVMNLHQAKGLQAPVVILAAPTSGLPETISQRIVRDGEVARGYLSIKKGYSVLAEPHDWETHQNEELQFLRYERVRLLYVAATRAGDALVVSRWAGTDRRPKRPWQALEPFLTEAPEFPLDPAAERAPSEAPLSLAVADQAAVERRARWAECTRASWSRTSVTASARKEALVTREIPLPAEVSERGADAGTAWGDLIHRLLEHTVRDPQISDEHLAKLAQWFVFDVPEMAPLIPLAMETVREVMESDFWQRVIQAGTRLVEVPFGVGVQQGQERALVFGVVDLALEGEAGWDLVDYKTDRKGLDQLVNTYAGQLQEYARHWSGLAGEVQSARLFRVRSTELSEDVQSSQGDTVGRLSALFELLTITFENEDDVRWTHCFGEANEPLVLLGATNRGEVLGEPYIVWSGHMPEWRGRTPLEVSSSKLEEQAQGVARARRESYCRCCECGESCYPGHGDEFDRGWTCYGCMEASGVRF